MTTSFLRQTKSLNLAAADTICNAAIAAVSNLTKYSPMCVTVLDSSGDILVQKRMDECPAGAYIKFSYAKARTCIHLQTSSRQFRMKYTGKNPTTNEIAEPPKYTQAASMVSIMDGGLIPVAGGILVQDSDGSTVGAVGVSGAAADEDEYLAIAGVLALCEQGISLKTVPAEHSCTTLKA